MGLQAYIAMPSNAPLVKKAAVRGYGATIVECGPNTHEVHIYILGNGTSQGDIYDIK